ncbi:MAG: SusC/RagA family TonB-linked outer membrane protein [Bacteroidaceae bacterium]|nr:SusC/RagA family TonB-linked outer membrane protein [Bacteroidaceae bacterium]
MNFRALVLAVSLVLLPLTAIAQTTISGVVRETNGEPIPGASVREKGTTNGAATDLDGKFSFKVSDAKATIVVSFVGYQTQEFALSGRKNLTITLLTDDELLDDVVVVGYGTMKKKLVTGATVQVKGEDIAKMNTTNALTAMQSQTPGVNITQSSTQPGKGFKVNIRGAGTIAKSSPLLIIDGIVSGTADDGLNGLNPNDIERIDVLKDAASAAIYGARAANGVILVTTKQGKEGKLSLQYDGYVGWSNAYKRPATLGAQDYMKVINETSVNTTGKVVDWASMMPAEIYQKINGTWNPAAGTTEQYPNIQNGWNGTDWWKTYENKNAVQTSHAVSLTGGTDRSKFAMGVNYSSNEGVMGGDNIDLQPLWWSHQLRARAAAQCQGTRHHHPW